MSPIERLITYLKEYGEITKLTAYRELGISNLDTYIGYVQNRGYRVIQKSERCGRITFDPNKKETPPKTVFEFHGESND